LLVSFPIIWSTLLCYIFYILQYLLFDSILFTENYLLELAIIPDSIKDKLLWDALININSNYNMILNLFTFSWSVEASTSQLLMPLLLILIILICTTYINYFNIINDRLIET